MCFSDAQLQTGGLEQSSQEHYYMYRLGLYQTVFVFRGGGELYALPSAKTVVFKYRSFTVDFDCYAKIAGVQ